jgi:hypothetical protein
VTKEFNKLIEQTKKTMRNFTKKGALLPILFLLSLLVQGQSYSLDELRSTLAQKQTGKLTFEELIEVQQKYANDDKKLTQTYGKVLLARKDFMAVDYE